MTLRCFEQGQRYIINAVKSRNILTPDLHAKPEFTVVADGSATHLKSTGGGFGEIGVGGVKVWKVAPMINLALRSKLIAVALRRLAYPPVLNLLAIYFTGKQKAQVSRPFRIFARIQLVLVLLNSASTRSALLCQPSAVAM